MKIHLPITAFIMKKVFLLVAGFAMTLAASAQDSTVTVKSNPFKSAGRANDHLMVQLGYTGWAGQPDTINTGGFSKSLNIYFMLDLPFKSNPKLSVGIGAGIGSDNIIFRKTYVDIKGSSPTLDFKDLNDTNYFKKTKLATTYLEAPLELRFVSDPNNSDRSFKAALGVKVGTMLNAHTRNRTLKSRSGTTLNDYTLKEASKRYFNTTRIAATARIGWGHFTLYGSYQLTNLFKDGVAAEIRPYSIGITLSGL